MGGAVSSGESNDDLIDNLKYADYIKTPTVERIFRAVDRAFYYTKPHKQSAYKDTAWKDGNLHISAPCIYSEVMENLQLESGMSFLNIGSGTGYLSTMAGLILGHKGSNHGIELYEDVTAYAKAKLHVFLKSSSALDMFDFCEPQFMVGNCLEIFPSPRRYDRIYCGAACQSGDIQTVIDLLKLGGICIVPIDESLVKMTRVSESRVEMRNILPVTFTTLVPSKTLGKKIVGLPEWNPPKLAELCRAEIRGILRHNITISKKTNDTQVEVDVQVRKKRRKKRNDRRRSRRANRLLLVQNRRNGDARTEGNESGLVTYSESSQDSSDEDCGRVRSRGTPYKNVVSGSEPGFATENTTELIASTTAQSSSRNTEAICDQGTKSADAENCNCVPQLKQTRSELILNRIRDLVRNRQLERAQRANLLLLEVEEALKDPVENGQENPDMTMNEEIGSANQGNDDDIDQECVWTSSDTSSSSTSSSSTSTSSSDNESIMVDSELPESNGSKVNSGEAVVDDSRSNDSPSPSFGFPLTLSPPKIILVEKDGVSLTNAQMEIESIEEGEMPVPIFHPFSLQMMQQINLLPLPPAIKNYLNYHRKM